MTTTLGLWQIVALIVLTLIVSVILNRAAILIVLALHHHWSKQSRNPISLNEKSQLWQGWSVSGDATFQSDQFVSDPTPEAWSGTGIQPTGLSYSEPLVTQRRMTPKHKRKMGLRWRKGKHPHVN